MKTWKARVITALIVILFVVLAADVVALVPKALPWILGAFAIPGVIWFSRLLYRWVTEEDKAVSVPLPSLWGKKGDTKPYAWYRALEDEDA